MGPESCCGSQVQDLTSQLQVAAILTSSHIPVGTAESISLEGKLDEKSDSPHQLLKNRHPLLQASATWSPLSVFRYIHLRQCQLLCRSNNANVPQNVNDVQVR